AAVAAVWVQVGIGLWLLVAPRGRWSQVAGIVSVGWGLVVWVFGEAFGEIFAPGLTFLFGAPGAVLFYCLAGGLVALPERVWSRRRTGRLVLVVMGCFFLGMAVLQAWPGRGFWQGELHGHASGALVSMVDSMAQTSQPPVLAGWLRAFGSFDAAHGFAVNLLVVVILAAIGLGLCSGRVRLLQVAVLTTCVFCILDWVLVEDLGFFGGLGTDPNSMIPIALVVVGAYLACTHPGVATAPEATAHEATAVAATAVTATPAVAPAGMAATATPATATPALSPPVSPADSPGGVRGLFARAKRNPAYTLRALAAAAALAVTLLGAAPMAVASTDPHADAIITEATNGTPQATDVPASGFDLTDQSGRAVSLASLRGKTVALTFLDPVCSTECPIIGAEFRQADLRLGPAASHVEFVAIVANPLYRSRFFTDAFDDENDLAHLANWLYLTGSVAALNRVWEAYGVQITVSPAGAMVDHSDIAYVIDAHGRERYVLSAGPGAGTSVTESSFAGLLDQEINSARSES
ncbi:MAG TPA: SCO family protein, partial [Acidimicrobiales bacterium]|nr:SCO family protein [Acidimicrobiales bacterium]